MNHLQTVISELRKELKGKVKNASEFIETKSGEGEYRLSTNPSFIKAPGAHWLKQKFKLLLPVVQKERARRVKIAKNKGKSH